MQDRVGAEHYWEERHETAEACAGRIVAEELQRLGWRAADLGRRAKGDAAKVALAARLLAETVMPVNCIAERQRLGAAGHARHLLQRHRNQNPTRSPHPIMSHEPIEYKPAVVGGGVPLRGRSDTNERQICKYQEPTFILLGDPFTVGRRCRAAPFLPGSRQ
jgi:hypothetical protein